MKKIISLALCLVMALSLVACGGGGADSVRVSRRRDTAHRAAYGIRACVLDAAPASRFPV